MVGRHHGKAHGRHWYGQAEGMVQAVRVELPVAYLHVHGCNHFGAVAPHYAYGIRLCRNVAHAQQATKCNYQCFHACKVKVFAVKTGVLQVFLKKITETFARFPKKPYLCIAFEKKAAHNGRLERW